MSDLPDRILILIAAFGIEAVLAYPAPLFRAIGHPVSWIGALSGRSGSSFKPWQAVSLIEIKMTERR